MGLLGVYLFTKDLLIKKPGVIIDENGIANNITGLSFGFISWNEISAIYEYHGQVISTSKEKIVAIQLKDPDAYIARSSNQHKRKVLEWNLNNLHSPVYLSAASLAISHAALLKTVYNTFEQYKSSKFLQN